MISFVQHNAVEPMQVDAPPEDNDNTEEEPYNVENPTLVKNFTATRDSLEIIVRRCAISLLL